MNTKPLMTIALVALLGANAASAQEAIPATWANEVAPLTSVSAKTRAEVKTELALARANGELSNSADNESPATRLAFVSTKTRAEVKAEALHAMTTAGGLSQGDRTGG